MTFEKYLEHITKDPSEKDIVGLAMYYLLEVEENDKVRPAEVRNFLKDQPVAVNGDNVVAYPSQLKSAGFLDSNNGDYILTLDGKQHFESMVEFPSDTEEPREDRFLDISEPESEFYHTLVEDIERTHTHHVYDATLILTRKLFENLLIEIMRGHYGVGDSIDMYYDTDRAQFKSFSTILENFQKNIKDFKPYALEISDDEFLEKLDSFRKNGNASAHSITVNIDGEIDSLSEDATEVARLLFRVKKQVEAAPDTWNRS